MTAGVQVSDGLIWQFMSQFAEKQTQTQLSSDPDESSCKLFWRKVISLFCWSCLSL